MEITINIKDKNVQKVWSALKNAEDMEIVIDGHMSRAEIKQGTPVDELRPQLYLKRLLNEVARVAMESQAIMQYRQAVDDIPKPVVLPEDL